MNTDLNASEFDQMVSLRDAYRCMEMFIEVYVTRGDGAVSEFLDFYVNTAANGLAENSSAPKDFLNAFYVLSRNERR
ncbi:hypothetical protein HUX88_11440 [Duganella sp. BJB1802]|uniref:hypothetical protein n=1 Tax=Duganella sp. BJB1802 TaxID=2744575 RepID=UPI0015934765|nr:hypothetical protein [Duganella sp. BJB1802]NVD71167.1 hypothetical protein [Duganella sp. BJB1802]